MTLMRLLYDANEEYFLIHGVHAVPPGDFANEVISGETNLQADYVRWLTDRHSAPAAAASAGAAPPRTFSFCAFPFILDAAAKSQILGFDAQHQMEQRARQAMMASLMGGLLAGGAGGSPHPYFVLRIRREHLLEDALQGIVSLPDKSELKKPLRVVFSGEEGIDAGGVRREFFQLCVRQLFTPDWGMFVEENRCVAACAGRGDLWKGEGRPLSMVLLPPPPRIRVVKLLSVDLAQAVPSTECRPAHPLLPFPHPPPHCRFLWFNGASLESPVNFELVGSLVGLAIYNSVLLDVHFPLAVYRKLKSEPFALSDLDDFKPDVARNLRMLLEYKGEHRW